MPDFSYPQELSKSYWDKKKGSLDGAAELEGLLKALEKKHDGVDWKSFAPGWSKPAAQDAAKLKALYEALDKSYRTKASPLKNEAGAVASAADKAAKAKTAGKPLKDACSAIDKAATLYGKAITDGLDALEREHEQAAKADVKLSAEQDGDGEDEASSALLDPKRLLKQLQLCKADPARQLHFALLDDGKQDPMLAVHVRQTGRSLFAKLVKDIGIKTGAFGQLSLDGVDLLLVVEKKVSGLAKRIRIPIRACGFKLGKVRQLGPDGESLEEDQGDPAEQDKGGSVGSHGGSTGAAALEVALTDWQRAREAAITALKMAAKEIAEMRDPESAKAILEIQAVIKNLTERPASAQQVAELTRYVDQDDVVLDVSEFASDIRTPLLRALDELSKGLAA
jgi:hypothetical protein